MKRIILSLLAITIVKILFSQEKLLNTQIEKVTVFKNGAQVVRKAKAKISPGVTQLIISDLPIGVNDASFYVSGKGNFTIVSVNTDVVTEEIGGDKLHQITELEKKVNQKLDSIDFEKGKLEIYQKQLKLLSQLEHKFDTNKEFSLDEFKDAMNFQNNQLVSVKKLEYASNIKIKNLQDDVNKLRELIQKFRTIKTINKKQATVIVSSSLSTVAELFIGYYLGNAGWNTSYDICINEIGEPAVLLHKANIFQNTGEDWDNVLLTLSDGNPMQGAEKPVLPTWYLDYNIKYDSKFRLKEEKLIKGVVLDEEGTPFPGVNILIEGSNIGAISDLNGQFSVNAPKGTSRLIASFLGYKTQTLPLSKSKFIVRLKPADVNLDEVVVVGYGSEKKTPISSTNDLPISQSRKFTTFEYEIKTPYSIPSDGKKYVALIQNLKFATTFKYYVVPKLDKSAYLFAEITGWKRGRLQSGQMNLYLEGTYIGKVNIDDFSIGKDSLLIPLGKDNDIRTERREIVRENKEPLFGKNVMELGYEISIKNEKEKTIHLIVEDQLPVSMDDEIEILPIELSDGGKLDKSTQKLKWELTIEPLKEKSIVFRYTIKYHPQYSILLN